MLGRLSQSLFMPRSGAATPLALPSCKECGEQMTAATVRHQMYVRRDGERRVFSTCRRCKARQLLVLSRLKKRMPTPPRGTPCECCGEVPERLELDHCHRTGEFRGWLCGRCNLGIGMLQDSLEGALMAAVYLSRGQPAEP